MAGGIRGHRGTEHRRAGRRRLAADFALEKQPRLVAHCVACQPDTNEFAQSGYGVALVDFGRLDEAMEHYAKAFAIDPRFVTPRTNYAGILQQKGRWPEALKMCDQALKIEPDD